MTTIPKKLPSYPENAKIGQLQFCPQIVGRGFLFELYIQDNEDHAYYIGIVDSEQNARKIVNLWNQHHAKYK